jgi:hypothetical protein
VQQKANAVGSQLQDCRSRKAPVNGYGIRALSADRAQPFAAMPYLRKAHRWAAALAGALLMY